MPPAEAELQEDGRRRRQVRAVPQAQAAVHLEPPAAEPAQQQQQHNCSAQPEGARRRRPEERAKTLSILPRSPAPVGHTATAAAAAAAGMALFADSASESGSSSCYSHDQDTTASVIPVMSERMLVVTESDEQQHQQHPQYMEPICWPGHAVTAAEFGGAAFPPYLAPCWPNGEEIIPRVDFLVGGDYSDESASGPRGISRPIQAACGFPNLDLDLDARDDDSSMIPPSGAHIVQLQPTVAMAMPITSLHRRDPAYIREDLGPYTNFHPTMGFGPGFVHCGGDYGPGSRVRFDWQPIVCAEPSFQGEIVL
ncbi:hypothetical protein PG994_001075 [Apiospora phragmitis]|uniref:Uncharacterized protein n=1 Tax=Apiospora phragmitis TaxID=2905665 RepID=A0ABR1WSH1_9PEZI